MPVEFQGELVQGQNSWLKGENQSGLSKQKYFIESLFKNCITSRQSFKVSLLAHLKLHPISFLFSQCIKWRLLFGNLIFWELKIPTRSPYTRYLFLLIPTNTSNLAEQNNSSKFVLNLYLSVICLTVPTSLQNLFLCLSRVNLNIFSSKLKIIKFLICQKWVF